jgi:hypothetical protein
VTEADAAPKSRFLVLNDYGMGSMWWWVSARSPREVLETFAEVDIDASAMPAVLDGLRATRDAQRARPGFGALADRSVVHLRRHWDGEGDDDPMTYLMEVGPDGRRLRQVELAEDGTALKSGPEDWPFNPPVVDLFDPDLAGMEISQGEFEAAWLHARSEDGDL